jgi:phosphoribosylaminoimidazole carboxylase (NCAIR synthetase)
MSRDTENIDTKSMEDCLTVISPLANATLFEFHRQRLAKQGYMLASKIQQHRFELVDEDAVLTKLLDGKSYYAATYIKTQK